MNREDIIRLAREAGLKLFNEGWTSSDNGDAVAEENLEHFAALVATHEREACAKVAEVFALDDFGSTDDWPDAIAAAIRSRT